MPPAGQRKKYNGSGAKVVTQLEVAEPDEAEGWERKQDFQDVEGGHWGGGERQKDDRQQHCSSSCAFRDTHHTPQDPQSRLRKGDIRKALLPCRPAWRGSKQPMSALPS